MEENTCIKIWRWHDAPERFQSLSTHGGDEDWVIFCPSVSLNFYFPAEFYSAIQGQEDSYCDGWGHVDRHELENGDIVVIFAHA